MDHLPVLLTGFAFSLSLLLVIGAQNSFVLRQGLSGQHIAVVVGICSLSDVVLMSLGVAGIGTAMKEVPHLLTALSIGGAAFLAIYGTAAARRALRSGVLSVTENEIVGSSILLTALTCAAMTWLNPQVYLDTLVLLGSVANSHHNARWWFGLGAMLASALWFIALGFGARWLRPVFARPNAWRVLDATVALVMVLSAGGLLIRLN